MFRPLARLNRSRNAPAETRDVSDPFFRLQNEMNRLFDDVFFSPPRLSSAWSGGEGMMMTPQVDLKETPDALEASVDLPGVKEDDIDVEIADNVLTLRGEKRFEREEGREGGGYHFVERSYGSFARSIPLPVEIDEDRVEASFSNGVLRLSMPKRPEARTRARKIAIGREASAPIQKNGEGKRPRADERAERPN